MKIIYQSCDIIGRTKRYTRIEIALVLIFNNKIIYQSCDRIGRTENTRIEIALA